MTEPPLLLALDLTGTFVFAVNGALTGLQAARLDSRALRRFTLPIELLDAAGLSLFAVTGATKSGGSRPCSPAACMPSPPWPARSSPSLSCGPASTASPPTARRLRYRADAPLQIFPSGAVEDFRGPGLDAE